MGQKKILIIDDDVSVIEVLQDILAAEQYECISFTDPEKGIVRYRQTQESIDIVLLDYSMPKMNGREVLIELRKINPIVKVIVNSGYIEEDLLNLIGDIPPNAFNQKPNIPSELLATIKKVLSDK